MKRILLLAAAAMMLFACSKEDEVADRPFAGKGDGPVFYAAVEGGTVPGTGTKVYADENLLVLWNADDRISIFNKTTYNFEYSFMGEDGDNFGVFEQEPVIGFISGNEISQIYAVYPYSTSNKVNNKGTQITVNLPSVQAYKAKSFGIGANTMVAVTDDQFLSFKNVCGYLKFRFWGNNVTVKSVTLKGNNGEKIAGKAFVTPSASGAPTVEMDGTAIDSIKMTCAQPVTLGSSSAASTEFIFVIPPTTFSNGFTVTVTDVNGQVFEKSSDQSLTITRNRLESMGAIEVLLNSNTFVEFDDANFKAYCVQNFDTNGDGEISLTEAETVTRINVYTNDISSLGGIEHFQNLRTLICCGRDTTASQIGQLTNIDVSSNTKLDSLFCYSNKLTQIDVSNNTQLRYLFCYYNMLTQIDVSHNPILRELHCYHNQITSLDFSNNPDLLAVECSSNRLTQLNVSNNPSLWTIYCPDNQLTQLDISNNNELRYFQCQNNQISELDVAGKNYLIFFACHNNMVSSLDLSNKPNLSFVACHYNELTQLDIRNSSDVSYLDCSYNQLPSLDLSGCTGLLELHCNNNNITELSVSSCPSLGTFWCGYNQITSLDVSNNTALKVFICDLNQLTSLNVSNNTSLTDLGISGNSISSIDLSNNTALKNLWCWTNQLTSLNVSNNTALEVLVCDNNQITSLDVSSNTALRELWCSWNYIGSLDVNNNRELTVLHCDNNNLTTLNISRNTLLSALRAWAQRGTLAAVVKKQGQSITYYDGDVVIDPADYGTTIIEVD